VGQPSSLLASQTRTGGDFAKRNEVSTKGIRTLADANDVPRLVRFDFK